MEPDGKIGGKFPIFDNILAFLWCKMNTCPKDILLSVVQKFYTLEDVVKARETLFMRVSQRENEPRRVKHRKVEEILSGVYTILQGIPTEDPPVFVALDLNKIPCVELSKIDGVAIIHDQNETKQTLNKLVEEQKVMRQDLSKLENLLSHGSTRLTAQAPSASTSRNQPRSYREVANPRSNPPSEAQLRNSTVERDAQTTSSVMQEQSVAPDQQETHNDDQRRGLEGDEDFTVVRNRNRRRRQSAITGTRTRNLLNVVPVTRKSRVFVSRLGPNTTADMLKNYVKDALDKEVEVTRLQTRYPTYASFVVSCNFLDKDTILSADSWEEGVLVREFRGKLPTHND